MVSKRKDCCVIFDDMGGYYFGSSVGVGKVVMCRLKMDGGRGRRIGCVEEVNTFHF